MLGYPNQFIEPVLMNSGYPLKEIALKIPLPEYNREMGSSAVPDIAYSSENINAALFFEAKTGGADDDQLDRFLFVQKNPSTLIRTPNNLNLTLENVVIDFGIMCTNLEKIEHDDEISKISFPVLQYDKASNVIRQSQKITKEFNNPSLNSVLSHPIHVHNYIPLLYLPYSPEDNDAYIIRKIITIIIAESLKIKTNESLPPIEDLIIKGIPVGPFIHKEEMTKIIAIVKRILKNLFPDNSDRSEYNISKYITYKNGRTFIRKKTMRKFLEKMDLAILDLERGKLTRQAILSEFNENGRFLPDMMSNIDNLFNPDLFFITETDDLN